MQTLIITTLFLFGINSNAFANFNDGLAAYQKGDYKTAFNEWKPLAEQGDASAQFSLANMYHNGRGTLKGGKEEVKWYRKAANQGHAKAQYNLGMMYSFGINVLKDLSKAKYWIKKSYENPDLNTDRKETAGMVWNEFELWKY